MNNVAFTIDVNESKLKIMFAKNKVFDYKEYSFVSDSTGSTIDYGKIFSETLEKFVTEENIYPATATYVLPDKFVICDYIETPALSGKKLSDMLELEISTRYKQSSLYTTTFVPMGSKNGKSAFFVYMIRNEKLAAIQNALKQFKFYSRTVSFESAMIANAFLTVKPQNKRDNILFADIKDTETKITIIKDSKLCGFASVPYGKNLCDLQSQLRSAPPVLPTEKSRINNGIFQLSQEGNAKNNIKYLLRTFTEMRDLFASKYNIEDIAIKYNVPETCARLFVDYKSLERINNKNHNIAKYLELYGAVNRPVIKGPLF